MCQLLGVSTAKPVRMSFSWQRFAMRGSVQNPDGWGVAYAEARDVRILREPSPAEDSPLVSFLSKNGPASTTVISHVRRATGGARDLANTHPFVRVLGGQSHVFAHNGHVSSVEQPRGAWLQPVGNTDSELLFCVLLSRLESLWGTNTSPPLEKRTRIVSEFAAEMRSRGAVNFLYFDGITLFVHGHRKTVPGDGISSDPGLYLLQNPQVMEPLDQVPCAGIGSGGAQALVATQPLDEQAWRPLANGELLRLEHGELV